ncbi:hypothetical protein [Providencia sp. SP181]|uniref:hypothetical protein n=1 Tax=Providencia sp. SP181 TaxID=3136277 RepID=UPI003D2CD899
MKKILLSAFFVLGSFLSMPANADGVDDMNELKEWICKKHSDKTECEKLVHMAMTGAYSYGKVSRSCDLWMKNGQVPDDEKEYCENVNRLDDYFGINTK